MPLDQLAIDLSMVLLDDYVETCDHGVPFDEDCDECSADDWLVTTVTTIRDPQP